MTISQPTEREREREKGKREWYSPVTLHKKAYLRAEIK